MAYTKKPVALPNTEQAIWDALEKLWPGESLTAEFPSLPARDSAATRLWNHAKHYKESDFYKFAPIDVVISKSNKGQPSLTLTKLGTNAVKITLNKENQNNG